MDAVTLEFDNRLDEHLKAQRLYEEGSLWRKADRVVAVLLFATGVFLLARAGVRWWTVIWFPLAVAEWFDRLSVRGLQIRYFYKRNPRFLETYRLTFSDGGIHFQTASIDAQIAWSHYTRVIENDALVLLVYGGRLYTVIPKRAFRDGPQLAAFRSLVARHVTGRQSPGA